MSVHVWKVDGKVVSPSKGPAINWEDNRFFTLEWNGKKYLGEVTEEKMEQGYIRVKINHREFLLEKEGKLDTLIKELGLDKEKIKKYLFYANPDDVYNLCYSRYSKNVEIIEHYGLYEFTIIVRKKI